MKNRIISKARAVYYKHYERLWLEKAREEARRIDFWNEPLISVYCPTYNRKATLLNRAIYSVLQQYYRNFEFIIVGDCCTDGTGEMIKNRVYDKRVKFVNLGERKQRYPPTRENHWFAGPVVAANHALTLCNGKWIARIDDDDIWTRDHLQVLLSKVLKENREFISSAYTENRYGSVFTIHPEEGQVGGTSSWLYKSYLRLFRYNIDCWRKSHNRVNDLDLVERMRSAGVEMSYLDKVTYHIEPRPGETTIGSDVYRYSTSGIEEHFKFKE